MVYWLRLQSELLMVLVNLIVCLAVLVDLISAMCARTRVLTHTQNLYMNYSKKFTPNKERKIINEQMRMNSVVFIPALPY